MASQFCARLACFIGLGVVQVSFLAAFDCWALCYSAVGALEYTSAMAYKRSVAIRVLLRLGKLLPPCIHVRILLKIAIRSKSEKTSGGQRRKHHLCQYYDEVRECVHARGFVCLCLLLLLAGCAPRVANCRQQRRRRFLRQPCSVHTQP